MNAESILLIVFILVLVAWVLRPKRKISFESAVLAVKSGSIVLDKSWTVPASVRHDFPLHAVRLVNERVSIIYWGDRLEGKLIETIDMSVPDVAYGTGGLNITFEEGIPVRWGRFRDRLSLPGIRPGDAQKAQSILKDVRNALNR